MSFPASEEYSNIFSVYHGILSQENQTQTVFIIFHGCEALLVHTCGQVLHTSLLFPQ